MKKNKFDPFMISNFSNIIKQNDFSSLSTTESANNDLMSMTFVEKRMNLSIPRVRTGLVMLITGESIGENNELGNSLIKKFLCSIIDGLELPEHIFFVNTGVKLVEDSDILQGLRKIKKYGTNVVLSLESIEYFNFFSKQKVLKTWAIGDITTILINANQVIKI